MQIISIPLFFTIGLILNHLLTNSIKLPKHVFGTSFSFIPKKATKRNNSNQDSNKPEEFQLEIPKFILPLNKSNEGKPKEDQKKMESNENNVEEGKNNSSNETITEEFNIQSILGNYQKGLNEHNTQNTDIDLDIGDVLVLIGENGSGKTTFLNLISKMLSPQSTKLSKESPENLKEIQDNMANLGICTNENIFCPSLKVEENIKFFSSLTQNNKQRDSDQNHSQNPDYIQQIMIDFDLEKCKYNFPDDLSLGYKRALSIAIAFLGNPKLILLDNPTIGMNIFLREKVLQAISKEKANTIIIIATQFMDDAEFLGNKFVYLNKGKFLFYRDLIQFNQKVHSDYVLTIDKQFKYHSNAIVNNNNDARFNHINAKEEIRENIPQQTDRNFISDKNSNSPDSVNSSLKSLLLDFYTKNNIYIVNGARFDENKIIIRDIPRDIKISLPMSFLQSQEGIKINIFLNDLKHEVLQKSHLNLFAFSKQTLEYISVQIISNFRNNSQNDSPNSNENENSHKVNVNNQNIQTSKSNNCSNLCKFLGKQILEILKKRFFYLKRIMISECLILGIIFPLFCMIILYTLTLSVNFSYSSPIPRIVYDYSNYSNPFYIDIADPKYNHANETQLTNYYNDFILLLSQVSSFNYIQAPQINSINSIERIKNFYSFLDSQVQNSSYYTLGSLQFFYLLRNDFIHGDKDYYANKMNYFVNLTSPNSIGIVSSLVFDTLLRLTSKSKYSIQFSNYPQPVSSYTKSMLNIKLSLIPIGFYIFAITIFEFIIVLPLLSEIASQLDNILKLYMGRFAFWISYLILDFSESILLNILFLILWIFAFKFQVDNIWPMIMIQAIAIIPYYYSWMLIWKQFSFQQINEMCFLLINIFIGNLVAPFLQFLTRFDELHVGLGIIEKILQFIFPTFAVHQGLFYSLMKQSMSFYPENISYNVVDSKINLVYYSLASSIFFYLILIIALEFILIFNHNKMLMKLLGLNKIKMSNNNITKKENQTNYLETLGKIELEKNNQIDKIQKIQLNNNRIVILGQSKIEESSIFDLLTQGSYSQVKMFSNKFFNSLNLDRTVNQKNQVGYSPEYLSAIPYLTAKQNIEFYLSMQSHYKGNEYYAKVKGYIAMMNLTQYQDQPVQSLSDGTKKLLKLAISLICDSSLFLIDDLSSELDPFNKYTIWKLIQSNENLKAKHFIIYSNNIEESISLSNNFILLNKDKNQVIKITNEAKSSFNSQYNFEYSVDFFDKFRILNVQNEGYENEEIQNLSIEDLKNQIISELNKFKFTENNKNLLDLYFLTKNNLFYDPLALEENILKDIYLNFFCALKKSFKLVISEENEQSIIRLTNFQRENDKVRFKVSLMILCDEIINFFRNIIKGHINRDIELIFFKANIYYEFEDLIESHLKHPSTE